MRAVLDSMYLHARRSLSYQVRHVPLLDRIGMLISGPPVQTWRPSRVDWSSACLKMLSRRRVDLMCSSSSVSRVRVPDCN